MSAQAARLRAAGGIALLALSLQACGNIQLAAPPPVYGREPVERSYQAPVSDKRAVTTTVLAEAPAEALAGASARLVALGYAVTIDPAKPDSIAASRTGDGEPYLDCGSYMLPSEDGQQMARVPAARLQVRIPVLPVDRREAQLRQLRLDSRIQLTASPMESGAELELRGTYVVTRTVDRVVADGRMTATSRDTIAFGTNEAGHFPMGLTCIATGRLESEILGIDHI